MSIKQSLTYWLLLYSIVAVTWGCTRVKKRKEWPVNRDAGVASVTLIRHNFLDSVAAGDELSPGQISRSTIIDSMYRKEEARFRGDTVYAVSREYTAALLDYSDGKSCLYKMLLIFNSGKRNTDYTIVQTDCDEDAAADFTRISFRLLSDSSFNTREDYYKKLPEDSMQLTTTIRTFVINKAGMIEPVKTETEKKPSAKRED